MASKYVNPVKGWGGSGMRRSDQGQDFAGTPGDAVVAIGKAKVVYVNLRSTGFGNYIIYELLDGPSKGTRIYVGHAQANVVMGQPLKRGQRVATLLESGLGNAKGMRGWTEIGVAGSDNYPLLHGTNATGGGAKLAAVLAGAAPTPDTTTTPDTTATAPGPGVLPTTADPTGQVLGAQLSSSIDQIPQVGPRPAEVSPALAGGYQDTTMTPVSSSANSWQLIASQGNVSQDTIRLAQLASYGNGASSG